MSQNYSAEEAHDYPEIYRSEEYNSPVAETTLYEITNTSEYNSEAKSGGSSEKKTSAKKNSVTSGLLTAVGGVAGATVITATAVVTAVLQITLLSFAVTMRSISVDFSVENVGNAVLTAYLTGEETQYSLPVEIKDRQCSILFDSLTPDCEYLLEVKDEEGNVYYSGKYKTDPFFTQTELTVTETEINFNFYLDNPEGAEYRVGIDGSDEPRDFYTFTESGITANTVFDMLEPGRQYALWIDGADGLRYFYRKISTSVISDPLLYQTDLSVNGSIRLIFDPAQLADKSFDVYLYDENIGYTVSSENSECALEGFSEGEKVIVQLKDSQTQELRMWAKIQIPANTMS